MPPPASFQAPFSAPFRVPFSAALARLIFPALLGFVLGTAAQLQQSRLWQGWVYAALLLAFVVLLGLVRRGSGWPLSRRLRHLPQLPHWLRLGQWLLVLWATGLLAYGLTGLRAAVFLSTALNPVLQGHDVRVTGVVASLPQPQAGGVRFRFRVASATLPARPDLALRLPPLLDVAWYGPRTLDSPPNLLASSPADVQAGERWQFTLRLKAPHGFSNPWGYDQELWLWTQGVQATGYVRTGAKAAPPKRLGQTWQYPVEQFRQAMRARIFAQVVNPAQAGWLAALVVGDQEAIAPGDWAIFRTTGVAHLMSISGLHITMWAWLASRLIGWAWRRSARLCLALPAPHAAVLGGLLLALVYAVLSGWGVPAQRTLLMLAVVSGLQLMGKRWPWPWVWLLACVVVLLREPWALLQAGFWLSFVAVGVLYASARDKPDQAPTQANAAAWLSMGPRVLGYLRLLTREQWTVTLALTPLTLLLFGQVSLVGMAANALAIPWVTLLVTPLAMLGGLVPLLWDVAAWAIALLAAYLQWLATWPWAALSFAQAPWWLNAAALLGGLVLAMRAPLHLRLLGLPLLLPLLLWQAPRPLAGEFELLLPDVGQGNAVLVRTAKHTLLYDSGPRFSLTSDAGSRVLLPLLKALGTPVNTLVLSHRDSDHTGGAASVLAAYPQAELRSSLEKGHALLQQRRNQRCVAGQRWQWDGVDFEMLHPQPSHYTPGAKPNSLSCTLLIRSQRGSALLAADLEQAQEAQLLASATPLRADVLLVPHHGSKTSSSAAFLSAVAPRWALVQAGYRNRYGHPAPSVLARYAQFNITVLDTPHCGAITWRANANQAPSCQRLTNRRYWHHQLHK
jgi:competence protein ComEC